MILKYRNNKYKVSARHSMSILKSTVSDSDNSFSFIKYDENEFLILSDETNSNAYAAHDEKHIYVMIDGYQYIFDLLADEDPFMDDSQVNDGTHDYVKAPMPGSIVKVLVNDGDKVEEAQALIIIEAMKMETKLYSSISGTVNKINCKVGEQVDSEIILMEIVRD